MADSGITLGLFGRRKTGKTNLIASLAGLGDVPASPGEVLESRVSIPEYGNAVLLVPAGLDDERALGTDSVRAKDLLARMDVALLVIDVSQGWSDYEKFLLSKIRFSGHPTVGIINTEAGEDPCELAALLSRYDVPTVAMDLSGKADPRELLDLIQRVLRATRDEPSLVQGLVSAGQVVWLIVANNRPSHAEPIGPAEVGLARDVLSAGAAISIIKESDFERNWNASDAKPDLLVADATVFRTLAGQIADDQKLTSLSILVSRQRGELDAFVRGVRAIDELEAGGRVLISESCMLHVQPDDIARVEIPNLLRAWVGGDLEFSTSSGEPMYHDIGEYDLVVRCGACMLDRETALHNLAVAAQQNSHVTNYGIAIAYMHGLLGRMLQPLAAAGELADLGPDELKAPKVIPLSEHDAVSKPPSM